MRFARAVLLLNARVACAFLLAGCELVLDPNSLVGKESASGAGHASSAGDTGSQGGDQTGSHGGDSTGGMDAGGSNTTSAGGSGAKSGASAGGGLDGQPGMPGQNGNGGAASSCKVSNKGTEICDGIDNDCDPSTPGCPANCSAVTLGGITYMACDKQVKWQNAELACLEQSMELVTVGSAAQNAALLEELQSLGFGPNVWLAAQDSNGNSTLTWPDGTVLAKGANVTAGIYQNFAVGQPAVTVGGNGRCLQMDTTDGSAAGTWSTTFCTDTKQFVCEPFGIGLQ